MQPPPSIPGAAAGLGARVRSALAWRWGSQVIAQVLTWTSTVLVVRLLEPSDYGLYAMTQAVVTALAFLNGQSFATSLIQAERVDDRRVLNGLLADLGLPLSVQRNVLYWLAPSADRELFAPDRCPIFIWEPGDGPIAYGFPELAGPPGPALAPHDDLPVLGGDVVAAGVHPEVLARADQRVPAGLLLEGRGAELRDLRALLGREAGVEKKLSKLSSSLPGLVTHVRLGFGMVKDYFTGAYRKLPLWSVASVAAALGYFIAPTDALPDFIPVLGYLDDAAVLAAVMAGIREDLKKYAAAKGIELE